MISYFFGNCCISVTLSSRDLVGLDGNHVIQD